MLLFRTLRSWPGRSWAALLPSVVLAHGPAALPAGTPTLSLEAALAEAFTRNPAVAAAAAEVDAARGRLTTAATVPYNPTLELDVAARRGGGSGSTDRGVALSQQLEIGGQRGRRVDVAERGLAGVEARYERRRRLLAASVALAFYDALAAAELAELADTEEKLAHDLSQVTRRRFEAGAATQIDLNLAAASTARAERRAEVARSAAAEARSLLAEVVGLDPAAPPRPAGSLALPAGELPSLDALIAGALAHRADLVAFRQAHEAARARLQLVRAERVPDLSLGAFYEREEGSDRILGGAVSFSLPILNRRRGEIAEATAAVEQARAEAEGRVLAVRRDVFAALTRYRAARSAAAKLSQEVVGSLAESLALLQRSFTAGKIGLSDLLLFRRELLDARREEIEATAEAWAGRIALDLAAGRSSVPPPPGERPPANEAASHPPTDSAGEVER